MYLMDAHVLWVFLFLKSIFGFSYSWNQSLDFLIPGINLWIFLFLEINLWIFLFLEINLWIFLFLKSIFGFSYFLESSWIILVERQEEILCNQGHTYIPTISWNQVGLT